MGFGRLYNAHKGLLPQRGLYKVHLGKVESGSILGQGRGRQDSGVTIQRKAQSTETIKFVGLVCSVLTGCQWSSVTIHS